MVTFLPQQSALLNQTKDLVNELYCQSPDGLPFQGLSPHQ